MKLIFAIIFLLSLNRVEAQIDRVYALEELVAANPDSVFVISLSKNKLRELPAILETFGHLRSLDLSKNRLTQLPKYLGNFSNLKELNAGKNKLTQFPIQICRMTKLENLQLFANEIETIPECVGYLTALKRLVLYDNPIRHLPASLPFLGNLKEVDLLGIAFGPSFQEKWTSLMPHTKFHFDNPCDCME